MSDNLPNKPKELVDKAAAAILADLALEGYVIYGTGELDWSYTHARVAFNTAATPEKKSAWQNAQNNFENYIDTFIHGITAAERNNAENFCRHATIDKAEIMAEVLTAAYPAAEKDLVKYFKYATDQDGQDPAVFAKVYADAGAPLLARIAQQAIDHPPCVVQPISHRLSKFDISIKK